MAQAIEYSFMMALPLLLQLMGLAFAVLIDPYIERKRRRLLLLIVMADFSLVMQNAAEYCLDVYNKLPYGRILTGIFGYCLRPLIIMLFIKVVDDDRKHLAAWALIAANTLVSLTAFFSDIFFTIDKNDHFHRGPLGYTCHVVSILLLAYLVWLTIRKYRRVKHSEAGIPLFNALGIIAAVTADLEIDLTVYPISVLTIAVVVCSIFYYIWLHLQFVREHEHALMAEQRIQVLMAQIKPHFIYNSLTAIRSYLDEPKKAEEVLNHFSGFLRGSIDVLEETGNIDADREFQTVENYLYLERERFGRKLTVEKDIQDTDFFLPAFTVQTLVENAVNHGVRKNPTGRGKVSIRSFRTEAEHVIEVEDDGSGFQMEKALWNGHARAQEAVRDTAYGMADRQEHDSHQNTDRSHIGLSNLEQRLRLMCGGELEIESTPGKGTLARVRIPKRHMKPDTQQGADILWKI